MSLYHLQKILYDINRDLPIQQQFKRDARKLADRYQLSAEELTALLEPDIGLLYVLGVNGQILMHYAAFHQIEWDDYLQQMRDGVKKHGAVRAGVYAMTGGGKSFIKEE